MLGILSAAIQEDAVVRWIPIDVHLHALQSGPPGETATWIRFGVPKALGALAFAAAYLRYGALPAWLLHGATNLSILLVLPLVAEV